jgi:hypothetical protein
VTARTANGIIQGVRHRRFTVEGVQFHPESILTEHGHDMLRNFLRYEGGTWAEGSAEGAAGAAGEGVPLDSAVEELPHITGKSAAVSGSCCSAALTS